jgi:hypothetical protein
MLVLVLVFKAKKKESRLSLQSRTMVKSERKIMKELLNKIQALRVKAENTWRSL